MSGPPSSSSGASSAGAPIHGPHWSRFLRGAESVIHLVIGPEGIVDAANPALERRAGRPLEGLRVENLVVESDVPRLLRAVDGESGEESQPVLLNFVGSRNEPFTLRCWWGSKGGQLELVGEAVDELGGEGASALLRMNNELATLSRENARKTREVEAAREELTEALNELRESYWHLRKVQEVLPICMRCERIRSEDRSWGDVVEYLRRSDVLFSHGLCPDCAEDFLEEAEAVEGPGTAASRRNDAP